MHKNEHYIVVTIYKAYASLKNYTTMVIRCNVNYFRKPILKNFTPLVIVLFVSLISFLLISSIVHKPKKSLFLNSTSFKSMKMIKKIIIPSNTTPSSERNNVCNYYNCFDVYKCGKHGEPHIQIYVYPLKQYLNDKNVPIISQLSKEFYDIVQSILHSKYYTPNPDHACIFLPPFDTLSQNNFLVRETSQALNSLSQ